MLFILIFFYLFFLCLCICCVDVYIFVHAMVYAAQRMYKCLRQRVCCRIFLLIHVVVVVIYDVLVTMNINQSIS